MRGSGCRQQLHGDEQMKRIQRGFTLIELMIVVAIIGILAAIAIPQYQDYIARSQVSEALTLEDGLKTSVAECINIDGAVDNCTNGNAAQSAAGLPKAATDTVGLYTVSVAVKSGVMTATMGSASPVSALIYGATVIMTPDITNPGSIVWKC